MPYIGNQHNVGDHINNFKVLDDISSYTATFDGSATSVVDTTNNTIRVPLHRFIQGQRVTYTNGGGGNINGLSTGTAYYISFDSANTIKLATSLANANSNTVINLSSVGSGTSHTLNAAFDGINTKFKLSHGSGTPARLNNATQINVAINNVVQRPNLDPNNFTDGFALEDNHKIVFKTAPTNEDIFWGSIIANTIENFDLRDNEVDNLTGDGSTTEFTLSTIPANNESVIVTIDGVLQHPSDKDTVRAYTLLANVIQFTAAPANNAEIQVRHIGFAGASTNDVSGFYGRTGNVTLTSNDNITTGNINAATLTASSANFSGNVSIGGTLTYEDVTNIDSVGIITARSDILFPTSMDSTDAGGVAVQRFWTTGNISAGTIYKCGQWFETEGSVQLLISVRAIGASHSGASTYLWQGGYNQIGGSGISRLTPLASGFGHGNGADTGVDSNSWGVLIHQVNVRTYAVWVYNNNGTATKNLQITVTEQNRGSDFTDLSSTVALSSVSLNAGYLPSIKTTAIQKLYFKDNHYAYFGDSQDLSIFHNGSHSIIQESGTGQLKIQTSTLSLENAAGNANMISALEGNAIVLHFNGAQKLLTTNTGINVVGNVVSTGADINGDLDVDGHTNLDNVSVAGVSTLSGNVLLPSNIPLGFGDFGTKIFGTPGSGGSAGLRFFTDSSSSVFIDGNHNVFVQQGNLSVDRDLDVDGHTNLDNVSIAGVTSCANSIHLNQAVPEIKFNSTTHENDFRLINYQGNFIIQDEDALANRLVIDSNGHATFHRNVILSSIGLLGIGTANPTATIHLHKASGDVTQKIESSNGAAALELRHTNGYGYIRYLQDGAETFRVGQIAQFTSYSVYNPNSSLPYQLCVEGNGEVGINTHNPANTLHLLRNTNHGITLQKGGTNPGSALIQVSSFGALKLEAANNLVLQSGGSQQIFFNRGSTEVAKFDTSGRFMIGTSTEGHVSADDLTIEGSGDSGITIRSGSSSEGSIMFSDGTSGTAEYAGWINYNHNSNFMRFFVGGERLRINSTGAVMIGTISSLSFNGAGGHHNLVVAGDSNDTDITDNYNAAITISNKDGTANNTAGLHFAREDTDGNPHYDGASVVAQFKETMNTGQYPKADLAFLTSSANNAAPSEKLRITSDGKVGIGTATPSEKLTVHTASGNTKQVLSSHAGFSELDFVTASTLRADVFANSSEFTFTTRTAIPMVFRTNGTNERLRIKSDGEVLLGTGGVDRPIAAQRFNSGNGWGGTLQIEKPNPSSGNNNVPIVAITAFNGANEQYTGGISFNRSNHNTQGTQGAVNSNQQLGNIAFNGSDGTNFIQGAEIFAIPEQTFATNDGPTSLVFATTPDGTSQDEPQERLRITSDGQLNLGSRTAVSGGTASPTHFRISRSDNASAPLITMGAHETAQSSSVPGACISSNHRDFIITKFHPDFSGNSPGLWLKGNAIQMYSGSSETMRLTSGGTVNIGGNYTQESKTLYVDGTIEATSNLTCVNQIYLSGTAPQLVFTDTNQDSDYTIKNDGGQLSIIDRTNSNATRLYANTGGFGGDRLYISNDIVHTGDTDTKIEFGTDIINFDTGGGERLRIDNDLVNIKGGNLHVGTDSATINFTDSNGGNTRHIEIGATSGGDALLTTHSSGYGIGYFGYHVGSDRLVIACDQGGGNNSIDLITTAGTSTGGNSNNLNAKSPRFQIRGNGGFRAEYTDANEVHAISNYDHGNNNYNHRGGRTLTSNGAGWDGNQSSDGSDPILVLSVENRAGNSDIGDAYGLQLHSESQDDNDYGPLIGWTNRSNSGSYNTTYAAIVGQKTGQATDHNWSSGALHFFTNKPGTGAYMDSTADMSINENGYVTKPRQPSFNVTKTGGQINSNIGLVVFDDDSSFINHNTGGHYSKTGATQGRFTAPVAGRYQINARMLTNSSTQSYTILLLQKNGSTVGYIGHNHSDYWLMESGSWVLELSENDYVTVYLQQHSGHGGYNYASFSGFLIG